MLDLVAAVVVNTQQGDSPATEWMQLLPQELRLCQQQQDLSSVRLVHSTRPSPVHQNKACTPAGVKEEEEIYKMHVGCLALLALLAFVYQHNNQQAPITCTVVPGGLSPLHNTASVEIWTGHPADVRLQVLLTQ